MAEKPAGHILIECPNTIFICMPVMRESYQN